MAETQARCPGAHAQQNSQVETNPAILARCRT